MFERRLSAVSSGCAYDAKSDVLHEFRIEERESEEFVLIQVHHKQFVGGRQVQLFRSELLIKVAHIFPVFLPS